VNRDGGRMLADSNDKRLQPIYRIHPAPDPEKIGALCALTRGVASAHGLPEASWSLHPGESLNAFLGRLPSEGPHVRVARALERQAILINMRSAFSASPSAHFGVGAEVYARFSAPMREVVGIFVTKSCSSSTASSGPVRRRSTKPARVHRDAANRSRDTQRKVNDHVNKRVLDGIFRADMAAGTRRRGTVMGITSSKIHVELDDPGMDAKVYLRDIGKQLAPPTADKKKPAPVWLDLTGDGATLVTRDDKRVVCAVGDAVDVRAIGYDAGQDRWVLGLDRALP
jgi:ribonuclease R